MNVSKRRKFITSALVVVLAPFMATGAAFPHDFFSADTFKVSYFDVATSAVASRSGYGGPGVSGGSGDNTVRIINTAGEVPYLCAMIYVFDDFEEMQTCCGCPVTPDGLRTLSVVNDLTFDFGVNKGNLNAGVIRIIPALPNFTPGNPNPTGTNPPGVNGPGTGTAAEACDPTAGLGNDPFHRGHPILVPAQASPLNAWITHDELMEPGNVAGGHPVQNASVDEFLPARLDFTEGDSAVERCAFLITNGSGSGVCTCGAGDSDFVAPAAGFGEMPHIPD